MAETVMMPKLGFDMAEGTLVRWVKAEGEAVNKGEVLAEIETDKATVEVESSFSGVVARHLVEQGAIVPVGTPIAIVGAEGEKIDDAAVTQEKPAAQLDKADETPRAEATEKPVAGSVAAAEIAPPEVQTTEGAPRTSPEQYQPDENAVAQSGASVSGAPEAEGGMVKASPLARRIADEKNIDIRQVTGSGPGGRVVKKDVEAFAARPAQPAEQKPQLAAQPSPAPVGTKAAETVALPPLSWGQPQTVQDERIAVNKLRGAIGRRMVESKQNVPHFYVTSTYDVAELLKVRKQVNEVLPDEQKISVNDFIVKAVGLTLRQFPNVNASLQGNEIVRHGRVSVGIAVALEGGLMTVVVKDADQKPLRLIASETKEMVSRARSGKVRPEDIEGSTFSISNMGMYDVDHFIAIINPPEAAILAVGSAMELPVVVDGELRVGMRMKATLSADHRVTDGAEAARFMQALRIYLEKPISLIV